MLTGVSSRLMTAGFWPTLLIKLLEGALLMLSQNQ
jgi:hypothetical protein